MIRSLPPRRVLVAVALGLLAGCGGGGGGGSPPPPTGLTYANPAASFRVGVTGPADVPTIGGGLSNTFTISPPLPAGLTIGSTSGIINGAPLGTSPTTTYTVTATNDGGSDQAVITVQATPALPAAFLTLEPGFAAEVVLASANAPVKMAFAPDGRLFFNELTTGATRIIDAGGTLLPIPFSTLSILNFGEQGLLGIAIDPAFATNHFVYVYASVPAISGHPDRNQVVRFTESANVGGSKTVILDDLPIGPNHNSGDVAFGPDGKLYVTLGETGNQSLSQDDASIAGRMLRMNSDGSIPADNPIPGSREWARGLRNSFDMTFHPVTGDHYASENGPMDQDEVNYIQKGKNFGWPSLPLGFPASQVGHRLRQWTPVIAPTGITFYTGSGFGAGYDNNLFLCSFVDANLRRLQVSGTGPNFTDFDDEFMFATWNNVGGSQNRPLDILQGPDGNLYISTFSSIFRIKKYP